jgi:hypothetical protein
MILWKKMHCPFCKHEESEGNFIKADGCPVCAYAIDFSEEEEENNPFAESSLSIFAFCLPQVL